MPEQPLLRIRAQPDESALFSLCVFGEGGRAKRGRVGFVLKTGGGR